MAPSRRRRGTLHSLTLLEPSQATLEEPFAWRQHLAEAASPTAGTVGRRYRSPRRNWRALASNLIQC